MNVITQMSGIRLPLLLAVAWAMPTSPAGAVADATTRPATHPAAAVAAAAAPPVPLRPGRLIEAYGEMLAGLNLSPNQMELARTAMRQTRDTFRARITDASATPSERADEMRAAVDQLDTSISALLNDDQKSQFAQRRAALRDRLREQLRVDAQRPAPASRPAATQPAVESRPGAPLAGRIDRAIVGLGLTDAQRDAIFDVLDPARDRIDEMVAAAKAANAAPTEVDRRVREIVEAAYGKVTPLLLQPQKARFEAQFRADQPATAPPLAMPAPGTTTIHDGMIFLDGSGKTMSAGGYAGDDPTMRPTDADKSLPRVAKVTHSGGDALRVEPSTRPAVIHVGDPMPAFSLSRLSGAPISQSVFANRPSVFVFGSLTSPTFRDRMPKLQALANAYGNGVMWVLIYTREANPGADGAADVPERNHDDKIAIAAHASIDDRIAAAKLAKQKLGITFEILPDAMDDKLTSAFGLFPNGAAIFDAQGKLVALEHWAEPFAIRRALDEARGVKAE